jgi:hypothetical protein
MPLTLTVQRHAPHRAHHDALSINPLENTMTTLELLRATVAAKQAYWDALASLEQHMTGLNGWSDRANDEIADYIGCLAAGADDASGVDEEHVDELKNIIATHPLTTE